MRLSVTNLLQDSNNQPDIGAGPGLGPTEYCAGPGLGPEVGPRQGPKLLIDWKTFVGQCKYMNQ